MIILDHKMKLTLDFVWLYLEMQQECQITIKTLSLEC